MKEVLFICHGNVGRSQMAEGFYNHLKGALLGMSAGIKDVAATYNGRPRADIVEVMREKGIDISAQTIKQVTEAMLDEVRTLVILCDPDLCPTFLMTSSLNTFFRTVEDPVHLDLDGVRQIRDQVEEAVLDLIQRGDI